MAIDYTSAVTTLAGDPTDLTAYQGKVMLVVNTASKCGFTPQYDGLEKLWQDYRERGVAVLGFPCNQFGKQEPGNSGEIEDFCRINYGVTFPMHEKIDVNGPETHPLFETLKEEAPGLLGSKAIKWNFTKFLVGADGTVLARFAPSTTPEALRTHIEQALAR